MMQLMPKAPTKEQTQALKKAKLNTATWGVLKEMNNSLIVKHRITGDVKVLDK